MKKGFFIAVMLVMGLGVFGQPSNVSIQLSYLNVSKTRGPISPGDIMEIRAVISVQSPASVTGVRFNGTIPVGTTYVSGSLAAKTNEGLTSVTNTGAYTDAPTDDRGAYYSATNTVRMNIGNSASNLPGAGGSITGGTTIPRFYATATIIQATFRVRIASTQGTILTLGGNSFDIGGTNYPMGAVSVYVSYPNSCSSFDAAAGNLIAAEFGGTFGTGTAVNRSASPYALGFTYTNIGSGAPQDGQYSVVKNTSWNSGTGRVHGVWDIFGDHSGTTTAAGNPAPSSTTNAGYMVLVNATYAPSAVFSYSISGLMNNMDYTVGFWIRNVCGSCAANPLINGAGTGPGVLPNLIFSVNGVDRYTTGNIAYNGQWTNHIFTFNSGTSTNLSLVIRNNAPGGGGNDWAIDDISLQRCLILLPVPVQKLSVNRLDETNVVKWTTANDDNVSRYVIEYSTNARDFEEAGALDAYGNGGNYSFSDRRSASGKLYYRVRIEDKSGNVTYSKVITLMMNGVSELATKVTPNPITSSGMISISTSERQSAELSLLDVTGRPVLQFTRMLNKGYNEIGLDLPGHVRDGIYIVQTTLGDGQVRSEKIMVRRGK